MIIQNSYYRIHIDERKGALISFGNGQREFIFNGSSGRPLFALRFRDLHGKSMDLFSTDARKFTLKKAENINHTSLELQFNDFPDLCLNVVVRVICPEEEPYSYWKLSLDNDTEYRVEWADFPNVIVPNDLIAEGGDARLLWPVGEGALIEDVSLREESWLNYKPLGYPGKGWDGYFPCSAQTQFMAYYGGTGGLYLGAHDEHSSIKMLEFHREDGGIKLEHRVFAEAAGRGAYKVGYDLVLGVFKGDWYHAADIYRNFYEQSAIPKPAKLAENTDVPQWLKESPVVVTYPVRGQKDTGPMNPNPEYYPYTNALPVIEGLAKSFDSKIMALLMQWEGTAPWAPPYVWPPYGGEEDFRQFVDELHRKGNLAGVYSSGVAWTDESLLEPQYNKKEQFESQALAGVMCAGPDGTLLNSLICNGNIRWGYDICIGTQFAEEVTVNEIMKIADSGCDYIQYFDQMHGGGPCFCYGKDHGHPPAPGRWLKEGMERILKKLHEAVGKSGRKVVLGCESAAAEPYIPYLQLNDVRFELNYIYGKPVPLYSYLYHQYINNFMGNQNCSSAYIDLDRSPLNLLQRISYSFVAGDMLTVVLKDQGDIHWDWCLDWAVEKPEQESVKTLVRNLNAWRKNAGKPYLCFGRMIKPFELEGTYNIPMVMRDGRQLDYPSLLTSRWSCDEGGKAQIIVNYTNETQEFILSAEELKGREIAVYVKPEGHPGQQMEAEGAVLKLKIRPLDAMMLEMK